MFCFALIASVVVLAGLFVACLLVFAIGKFNHLVTLRHRITTEMLQLDFALRIQAAELKAPGGGLPADFANSLALAEDKAQRAVSGRLTGDNLAMLSEASDHIALCLEATIQDEQDTRNAANQLEITAQTWKRIQALVDDYRRAVRAFPCHLVATVCGFDSLSPGNSLPGKFL